MLRRAVSCRGIWVEGEDLSQKLRRQVRRHEPKHVSPLREVLLTCDGNRSTGKGRATNSRRLYCLHTAFEDGIERNGMVVGRRFHGLFYELRGPLSFSSRDLRAVLRRAPYTHRHALRTVCLIVVLGKEHMVDQLPCLDAKADDVFTIS
eukprot:scaffold223387_cov30-Tisochrysis_lutea.AAC.3